MPMTSVLLQPKARGVDGVSLSVLRDFSKVAQAGFTWDSQYLGGTYGTHSYAIEASWAAGLPVMLNYERGPADAAKGYAAGQQAAQTAVAQATALGFLGEAPIVFSAADQHFTPAAGLDYHKALVDVLGPINWTGGAYGFLEMLALLAQQSWWPDDWPLWHWGGDDGGKNVIRPWTWVKQGPGGSYFDSTIGLQVDKNTLYKPMRFWSGYGPDHPTEDDMTPEEHNWLAHVNAVLSQAGPVVGPDGAPLDLYTAIQHCVDQALHRPWLASNAITDIVGGVVNALPTDGGVTAAQVVAALVVSPEFKRVVAGNTRIVMDAATGHTEA